VVAKKHLANRNISAYESWLHRPGDYRFPRSCREVYGNHFDAEADIWTVRGWRVVLVLGFAVCILLTIGVIK